jgi:hypothetical protein
MFGSARTVQGTQGLRQFGAALVALALALALAAAVALGQIGASKPQAIPFDGHAPIVIDRGTMEGPAKADEPASYGGWNGPRLGGTGTGGSNGTRLAQ